MATVAKQAGSVVDKDASGGGALTIALHPLVLLNISDHWTRAKVHSNNPNPRVIGAILGTQSGRNVEIFTSFELVYDTIDNAVVIDLDYLKTKSEQFAKVFPAYEFLGWYSNGTEAKPADLEIHKQFFSFNESPLFLLIDTAAAARTRELPIVIYETELHVIGDVPTLLFAKSSYRIATGEAERISVDHIARVRTGGSADGSSLVGHMMGLHNAIKMLNMRIKIIVAFLQATQKGAIPKDHAILRQIASLSQLLPAIDTSAFREDFLKEYNDALLVTYLASITKSTGQINELVDKFNMAHERHARRRFF